MSGLRILGTGHFLPDYVATNEEYTKFIDTSDEWIVSHTGIQTRHIAVDEPTWYMGAEAAKKALEAANIAATEIDVIIGTTVTADFRYPSMACLVQDAIGASNAFCFDISAACAASVYALDMARRYLETGDVQIVLIVSAETLSQTTNYQDRSNCYLFGDGAGACVLTKGEGKFGAHLGSDGTGAKRLYAKYQRQETPFSKGRTLRNFDRFPIEVYGQTVMFGHDVFRFATRAMPKAVTKACEKIGITPGELDLLIPHQANLRIIQSAARYMKLPMEKVYINIHKYGNSSSSTIMIALDECIRSGLLKPGDVFGAVGFGAGLVYGSAAMEYQN